MESAAKLFEYVKDRLPPPSQKRRLQEISSGAGVSYHTLLKIAKGETESPRVDTLDNLLRYFQEREAA